MERLVRLGYEEVTVLQAYIAADKHEDVARKRLLDISPNDHTQPSGARHDEPLCMRPGVLRSDGSLELWDGTNLDVSVARFLSSAFCHDVGLMIAQPEVVERAAGQHAREFIEAMRELCPADLGKHDARAINNSIGRQRKQCVLQFKQAMQVSIEKAVLARIGKAFFLGSGSALAACHFV